MKKQRGAFNMYEKILLPTDGSKNSERAIKHALSIAKNEQSEIVILNVVDSVYLTGLPEEELIAQTEIILEEESEKILENVKKIIEESPEMEHDESIKITPKTISEGNAADIILKVSEEENIDIVIIASSGKHMLDRFLLGSVTEKVVRHSKIPVMVIPKE